MIEKLHFDAHKLIFILVLYFLSTPLYGQSKQDKELVKVLDQVLAAQFKPGRPGCAVLIAKKGQIIYNNAFGSADLELNVKVQPTMVFRLGSITKQFTSIALLQLVEQGKISLQDS